MATQENKQVLRPLNVLVPLIKKDLKEGDEAARSASMPYYKAAGEKMLEAKPQLPHGKFQKWIWRNFKVKAAMAEIYMKYARTTASLQNRTPAYESLDEFRRKHLGETRIPGSQRDRDWREPVKQILGRVDTDTLNLRQAELKRVEERDAERTLAIQLIDIGYKTLATKLHPDKGGSRDAMARLNRVRDRLKQHA